MPTSKTVNLKLWRQNFERVAAVQGEDKARVLSMVISEREGVPFDMSGYTAEIYMHEANGRDVTLPAEIDGNIVTAVIPLITAAGDAAIQVILTKSTGEILKVAGIVLDVQPSELENAVDGSDEFNLLVGVTKQAEKAAGDALEAADIALEAADSVKARADSGEFNGEKGDTGPQGPQGVSGVYVGGGDMPEGYSVQVDPTGDMLCYTAGESDSRYANVLTGTASGPVAALEDVSQTGALRRAAVLGATTETGEGDKGPDNPYTIEGVQPTSLTVCGRNLLTYPYTSKTKTEVGVTFTDLGNGAISCSGTCTIAQGVVFSFRGAAEPFTCFPGFTYSVSGCPAGGGDSTMGTYCIRVVEVKDGSMIWSNRYNDTGHGITFQVAEKKQFTITFTVWGFATVNNLLVRPQIEISPAATPYAPYTGQTVPMPALDPLYGDGTVNDEYDAVTGVETRRWKQMTLDGTETISVYPQGNRQYQIRNPLSGIAYTGISSHYVKTVYPVAWDKIPNGGCQSGTWAFVIHDDACDTLDEFKAYLAAQVTDGTPVTVVYQLAEPVVTRHDPARILPPAPVCRVFADAGNTAVGYNRDVNIVIPKLEAALAELLGGGAQPMT